MDKKESEKIALRKFISAYKTKIDSTVNFEILEKEMVEKYCKNYNGENPDFVVRVNGELIGIEVFELIRNCLEDMNKSNSEKEMFIKNAAHLHAIRVKEKRDDFYLMEDLGEAALDRINDKIKHKVQNYIDVPIWLVGYADKFYNLFLLSPYFEDKVEEKVARHISNKVLYSDKVQKIFLAEFSNKYLLMQIK